MLVASSSVSIGRTDALSWVDRADPRKILCGMTVAPRIPTAVKRVSLESFCLREGGLRTGIEAAFLKDGLGWDIAKESITPLDTDA